MSDYQRKGKKYSKISYKKRMQLIDLIVNGGASITQTSKKLHVKLPTAKAILSSFRRKNHVFQRKTELENFTETQGTDSKNQSEKINQNICQQHSNKMEQVNYLHQQQLVPIFPLDQSQMPIWYPQMSWWNFLCGQLNFY